MRCSSFEVLLDRYVEGTLPPTQMVAVSKHLRECSSCTQLLTELRVVDALLATTKPADLAPNFTFAIMAEARTMKVPVRRSRAPWPALIGYLVVAWAAVCASIAFGFSASLRAFVAPAVSATWNAFAAVLGVAHGLGATTPAGISLGISVFVLDLLLVIGGVFAYHTLRPRLSARLDRSEAS